MSGRPSKEVHRTRFRARRITALGAVVAATAVPALWLGPPDAAAVTLGPLKSVRCAPMASDPPLEAPLYAQQEGASGKADAWWCQLPHATKVPNGLIPLRRDSAPLPNGYAIEQTVYSTSGTAKDTSVTAHGPPAIIVEVKLNSAVQPTTTDHVPQFTSPRTVALNKRVKANVLTSGGQTDVTWAYPTSGVPKYLNAVAAVTVAGFHVPASIVIAVAKQVKPT